jgi:hypothetical protein
MSTLFLLPDKIRLDALAKAGARAREYATAFFSSLQWFSCSAVPQEFPRAKPQRRKGRWLTGKRVNANIEHRTSNAEHPTLNKKEKD